MSGNTRSKENVPLLQKVSPNVATATGMLSVQRPLIGSQSIISEVVHESKAKAVSGLGFIAFVNVFGGAFFGLTIGTAAPLVAWYNCEGQGADNADGCVPIWVDWQRGLYAASFIIGAVLSSPFCGAIADRVGRRHTMMLLCAFGILGPLISALGVLASSKVAFGIILAGRIVAGLGVGLAVVVCPLYVGELSPKRYASAFGTLFQVFVCDGIFLAAGLALIADQWSNTARSMFLLACPAVACIFLGVLVRSAPESPKWLETLFLREQFGAQGSNSLYRDEYGGRFSDIDRTLQGSYRGSDQLHAPGFEPGSSLMSGLSSGGLSGGGSMYSVGDPGEDGTVTRGRLRLDLSTVPVRSLLVAFSLAVGNQLTGINAIAAYAPEILSHTGIPGLYANLLFAGWNFASVLFAPLLASRLSRRTLWNSTLLVCSIAQLIVGLMYTLQDTIPHASNIIQVIFVLVFVFGFEVGLGPLFFVLATEIFPSDFRDVGCSLTNVMQLLLNVIVVFVFPFVKSSSVNAVCESVTNKNVTASPFYFFSGIGILVFVLAYRSLPETSQIDGSIIGNKPHHIAAAIDNDGYHLVYDEERYVDTYLRVLVVLRTVVYISMRSHFAAKSIVGLAVFSMHALEHALPIPCMWPACLLYCCLGYAASRPGIRLPSDPAECLTHPQPST